MFNASPKSRAARPRMHPTAFGGCKADDISGIATRPLRFSASAFRQQQSDSFTMTRRLADPSTLAAYDGLATARFSAAHQPDQSARLARRRLARLAARSALVQYPLHPTAPRPMPAPTSAASSRQHEFDFAPLHGSIPPSQRDPDRPRISRRDAGRLGVLLRRGQGQVANAIVTRCDNGPDPRQRDLATACVYANYDGSGSLPGNLSSATRSLDTRQRGAAWIMQRPRPSTRSTARRRLPLRANGTACDVPPVSPRPRRVYETPAMDARASTASVSASIHHPWVQTHCRPSQCRHVPAARRGRERRLHRPARPAPAHLRGHWRCRIFRLRASRPAWLPRCRRSSPINPLFDDDATPTTWAPRPDRPLAPPQALASCELGITSRGDFAID